MENEIEKLAVDAIPVYPIYQDLLCNLKWNDYINHLRMEWVKGYKAALSKGNGWSDEDLRDAFIAGAEHEYFGSKKPYWEDYLQSLKSKTT